MSGIADYLTLVGVWSDKMALEQSHSELWDILHCWWIILGHRLSIGSNEDMLGICVGETVRP